MNDKTMNAAAEYATKQRPSVSEPALLDVRQVASLLGCSTRHVYRMSDAGKMPRPIRLGSLVRWSRASIDEWIAERCPPIRARTKGGAR